MIEGIFLLASPIVDVDELADVGRAVGPLEDGRELPELLLLLVRPVQPLGPHARIALRGAGIVEVKLRMVSANVENGASASTKA